MYQRDYIMRQIEFMVEVMQQVSGLAAEKRYPDALTAIDESLRDLFGLNGPLITRLFGREPLSQLTFGETADMSQTKFIAGAALLKAAGEIQAEQGAENESFQSFLTALELLLTALLNNDGSPLPEYAPEVEEMTDLLADWRLPTHLNKLLLRYYHKLGQLDEAENLLFEMIEQAPEDEEILKLGITFYKLILEESDAYLELGNLPREEAEAGLAELLGH